MNANAPTKSTRRAAPTSWTIKNGDIDFIINTPGSHDARADDIIIRSSAIAAKTSYCTNLASAQACVNAIEALKNKNLQVCTIQEYHAQNL